MKNRFSQNKYFDRLHRRAVLVFPHLAQSEEPPRGVAKPQSLPRGEGYADLLQLNLAADAAKGAVEIGEVHRLKIREQLLHGTKPLQPLAHVHSLQLL